MLLKESIVFYMQTISELEIYIHIPFCIRKCLYCDFLSATSDEETRNRYVDAIKQEVARKSRKKDYLVTSVFVGGGTPTVLTGMQLEEILASVYESFNVSDDCEITLECNPGTADYEKLVVCRRAGFNRLSLGLQSANDEELDKIGRIHSYKDFENTYFAARKAGFNNINVDLMTALPNQKKEDVLNSIDKIMSLAPRPEHISAYSLILEENTSFMKMYEEGLLELPDEDSEREFHWLVIDKLKEYGYEQYEISNMSRPGFECRHNIGYWIGKEYLGLGIGAASYFNGERFSNTRSLSQYFELLDCNLKDVEKLQTCENIEGGLLAEKSVLTTKDKIEEFMFLGLRMTDGISKKKFLERFGQNIYELYGDIIHKHTSSGLLVDSGDDRLYLSRRGQDLANYVLSDFLLD